MLPGTGTIIYTAEMGNWASNALPNSTKYSSEGSAGIIHFLVGGLNEATFFWREIICNSMEAYSAHP